MRFVFHYPFLPIVIKLFKIELLEYPINKVEIRPLISNKSGGMLLPSIAKTKQEISEVGTSNILLCQNLVRNGPFLLPIRHAFNSFSQYKSQPQNRSTHPMVSMFGMSDVFSVTVVAICVIEAESILVIYN